MERIVSRGMRLVFGAAVLAATGFGVRTAAAAPALSAETAQACPPGYYECSCDGEFTFCRRYSCPICP